jgi:LuxR family maltose regulon positive regulatory protein
MGLLLTRAMFGLWNQHHKPGQVIAVARQALDFSRRHNDLPNVAISLSTLAVVFYEAFGEFAEARQLLEEALAIDWQIGFDLNARWSERVLGEISQLQGQYPEATVHFEASVNHHYAGNIAKSLDFALCTLGNAALELGDDTAARTHFEESIKVATNQQRHEGIAQGRAGLGILAAFRGDINAAAAYYAESQSDLRSAGLNPLSYDKEPENLGFLALLLGHYAHALAHYEADLSLHRNTGYRIPLMCAHCRAGQALLGLADEIQAKPHLFDALGEAADIGALQVLLEALLGIAQLSVVPPTLAVELLALVCEHPASNCYSRTQAKRLLAMMEFPLAPDDLSTAIERGQALSLETAVALVESFHSGAETAQQRANQQLIDPLSQRELEMLALIAEGLTNQEIADRLYIGVSTVKKHINHIYGKLDVTHRAQAVAYARSLDILT